MLFLGFLRGAGRRAALLRSVTVDQITRHGAGEPQLLKACYSTMVQAQISNQFTAKSWGSPEGGNRSQALCQNPDKNDGAVQKGQVGYNVSRKDKINFLVTTLMDLKDSKEAVYGALDAWVAWEQNFPIGSLKQAICYLEKEQQWHRVVQVIKWMLSKGQGNTMRTYGQLIKALEMDHRAEEAHKFWVMKINSDLHSVPWQICKSMMSIYYRNNMPDKLVKLFKGLEAFGRKPPEKSIVKRVADTYELLGQLEEKERVLDKYKHLFTEEAQESIKKYRRISSAKSKEKKKTSS